jgi:hypothetical protein
MTKGARSRAGASSFTTTVFLPVAASSVGALEFRDRECRARARRRASIDFTDVIRASALAGNGDCRKLVDLGLDVADAAALHERIFDRAEADADTARPGPS